MSVYTVLLLSVIAGVAYALDGVAYRFGSQVNLNSRQVVLPIVSLSALVYLVPACGQRAPWWFIAIAVSAGLTQYVMNWVLQYALRWGPLTPMWCALMLCFIPVILYSSLVLHESLSICQTAAMLLAICAVFAAAKCNTKAPECSSRGVDWRYLVVLILLVCLNGASNIALKMASALEGGTVFKEAGELYMCCFFGSTMIPTSIEFAFTGGWPKPSWKLLASTALGAGGCCVGMGLLSLVVTAPAGLVYTVMNAASILAAGVMSSFCFHEKRTPAWYAMVVLSIAAIILGNR